MLRTSALSARIASVVIVIAICRLAIGQETPATQPEPRWQVITTAPIMVQTSRPIGRREIDRYTQILQLSEAQEKYLRSYYQDYSERITRMERDQAPALIQMAQYIADHSDDPTYGPDFVRWRENEEAFCAKVKAEDDRFFTALELILAEQQLQAMQRVRLHRQRQTCMPEFFLLRFAQPNLSHMIEVAPIDQASKSAVDDLMWEYEQAVTPALVKADQCFRENRQLFTMLRWKKSFADDGTRLSRDDPNTQIRVNQCNAERDAALMRQSRLQEAVGQINERYRLAFAEKLPSSSAKIFTMQWLSMVYPRAYPDSLDPEAMYLSLLKTSGVEGDVRDALNAEWEDYRRKYDEICRQLVDSSQKWQEQNAFTGKNFGWEEHNATIDSMIGQRLALNKQFISWLEANLPPSVKDVATSYLLAWHQRQEEWTNQRQSATRDYSDPS